MDGGEAVYFGERETGIWELPGLPSQFCCDLETALKHKVYWEICESFITQVFLGSSRCRNCQTEHTPSRQSTAQNTEGYLRALPHRPKGTFFFACFYNCWKKTFSSSEAQGRSKQTAVGQLPEKPYESMAASRLLFPGLHQHHAIAQEARWRAHLLSLASCPLPIWWLTCPGPDRCWCTPVWFLSFRLF